MDLTASANQLPIWVILIALFIPLVISLVGLVGSFKKANKEEVTALNIKITELEKRMKKCEKIRDYLLDQSTPEVKTGLQIYLNLSTD